MADHHAAEHQETIVSQSGGAIAASKTRATTPRRKKHTSQSSAEYQSTRAGEGRAIPDADAKELAPAPEITADHRSSETHTRCVSGADRTMVETLSNTRTSDPQKSPKGAHGAIGVPKPAAQTPHAKKGGHCRDDAHAIGAPLIDEAGQRPSDAQTPDARFVDPLIQQIVEQWRLRQDMVRAMSRLTLQSKAILRRMCMGDKVEANRLYRSLSNGKDHALVEVATIAVAPLLMAREPLEATRKAIEKRLIVMAKDLPIAHMVEETPGLGYPGLAAIIGECGDLSAYKSVSAVWKRCGLAVIDGGRQRKVAGDAAIEHGYSPSRRSVIWTIMDSLFKAQSAGMKDGAEPGPYRALYDVWKAEELEKTAEYVDKKTGKRETTKLKLGHAHNRALRKVSKRLLRDLTVAWRADRATCQSGPMGGPPDPQNSKVAV